MYLKLIRIDLFPRCSIVQSSFCMEISSSDLISLYTMLRNSQCPNVQEITDQINSIYLDPGSIIPLFEIAGNSGDPIIRVYSIIGIRQYIQMHFSKIEPQSLETIKSNMLAILQLESDNLTRSSAVNVVVDLMGALKGEWPELIQYMHTDSQQPATILMLLSHLCPLMPDADVNNNASYYLELINTIILSDDIELAMDAAKFLFQLVTRVEEKSQFSEFVDPLVQLFNRVSTQEDPKLLQSFTQCVKIGIYSNIIVIPLDRISEIIFEILQNNDYSEKYKYTMDILLYLYLDTEYTFEQDQLVRLFELQCNLCIDFYALNDEDPDITWADDVQQIFESIFDRMTEKDVYTLTYDKFASLYNNENAEYRFMALLFMATAAKQKHDQFDEMIVQIVPIYIALLRDPDEYVQVMACTGLKQLTKSYPETITLNLDYVVPEIVEYIENACGKQGTQLLSEILSSSISTDSIFDKILPLAFQWINSPDLVIQKYAINILGSLINQSQMQLPYFYSTILDSIYNLLNDAELKHPDAFVILRTLCIQIPENIIPHADQLVQLFNSYLQIEDNLIRSDTIYALSAFLEAIRGSDNSTLVEELYLRFFVQLQQIANSALNDETEIDSSKQLAAIAVQAMSRIYFVSDNDEFVQIVLDALLRIFMTKEPTCIHIGCESIDILAWKIGNLQDSNRTAQLEPIIACLLSILDPSLDFDFDTLSEIINTIAICMKNCGFTILNGREFEFIKLLIMHLDTTINPHTGEFMYKENIIDAVSDALTQVASTTEGNANDIIKYILPILTQYLYHPSHQFKAFAINVFGKLITMNITIKQLPETQKNELIQIIFDLITNGSPAVAKEAAIFVYNAARIEESRPLIEARVEDALTILLQRFSSISVFTNANVMMREGIVSAIASLGYHILNGKFLIPTETYLEILRTLPITGPMANADDVYKFLNIILKLYTLTNEMKYEYIRIYTWIFARPESQLAKMNFKQFVLLGMLHALKQCLEDYTDKDSLIAEVLDHDEFRIQYFYQLFERYKTILPLMYNDSV